MATNNELPKHEHSDGDVKICQECLDLMKSSAEKCRSLSEQSSTSMCKGGLSTAAFVCEGLAKSMEKCIEIMTKNHRAGQSKPISPESRPLM